MPILVRDIIKPGGLTEAWLNLTSPFEYPESYSLFALLIMASGVIDGRLLINPGAKPETKTGIYVLLYGPSGARKSEALLDALEILPDDSPVLPMNFSGEALRGFLHDQSETEGRAHGLILQEELATLLGGAEYLLRNSLFLSKLWDGRPKETFLTVAHKLQVVYNPYIVIGACATPASFADLDPKALSSGFLRREMIVQEWGAARQAARPKWNTVEFNHLASLFKSRFEPNRFGNGLMHLSPAAQEANEEWYYKRLPLLKQNWPGAKEQQFLGTAQVHAFKLAALLHLLEAKDANLLDDDSLIRGQKLVEQLIPGTFDAYRSLVPTPFARLRTAIARLATETTKPMHDGALDKAAIHEIGCKPTEAAEARLTLLHDGTLMYDEAKRIVRGKH